MLRLIYGCVLRAYVLLIRIVSPWNPKAARWIRGRRDLAGQVKQHLGNEGKVIWFHASSLGEFEQGRPLIEAIRERVPDKKILLTFFSPSGYEVRKDYPLADLVCYLPIDTRRRIKRFVEAVNPEVLFIIKYEFWYNLFAELKSRNVRIFLVSGIFREKQHFFRWWGKWFLRNLGGITWFFVQDVQSKQLLESGGYKNVSVTGDTRFDRVVRTAGEAVPLPWLTGWPVESPVVVAGSTWPQDEALLIHAIQYFPGVKWLIAPHQVDEGHVSMLMKLLPPGARRLSALQENTRADIIVIDSIGLLSRLYRYATIAYIGGGFGRGIHNLPEAAVYGCPVVFGPNYQAFREAHELIRCGGGFAIHDRESLLQIFRQLLNDKNFHATASSAAADYIRQGVGATAQILKHIGDY